jgi:hypothetical protein
MGNTYTPTAGQIDSYGQTYPFGISEMYIFASYTTLSSPPH